MNEDYKQYLLSVAWRNKRNKLFKLRGRKCERCQSRKEIQVHHKTYKHIYKERMIDLEILCKPCHSKHHGIEYTPEGQQYKKTDETYFMSKEKFDGIEDAAIKGRDKKKNPFMVSVTLDAIRWFSDTPVVSLDDIKVDEGMIIPKDGKVDFNGVKFTNSFLIERITCCKVFRSKGADDVMKNLNSNSLKLFIYIINRMPRNSDRIIINEAKYMKWADITSETTYYSALRGLIDELIIARDKPNTYWVNPTIIFNGDRLKKYSNSVNIIFDKYQKKDGDC